MANALYDAGRNAFARGEIHWYSGTSDVFKAILVDVADYTVNLATHTSLTNVTAAARVANATLTVLDPAAGVCDANDVTFTNVTGDSVEAIVIYKDTGVESTSTLIAYIDTSDSGAISVTPNGGSIQVVWSSGASKIFKL